MLVVTLGDATFGIPADSVTEVMRMPEITIIPGGPASLLGITLHSGDVLAVIKPSHVFASNQLHQSHSPTKMVVINDHAKSMRAALPVDRVVEITTAPAGKTDGEVQPVGTMSYNERSITVLDPESIISSLAP